jgi:Protein of unknown function (DUF3892)
MIYITEVHMTGGAGHQHIGAVRWRNPNGGKCGSMSRAEIVAWIHDKKGDARVREGKRNVKVGVVKANPPYIRTYADKTWTDNLLALPRY